MVSKALQTQRTFLMMVTTHQEPAQVRHTDTFSCSLSMVWRVKGIHCSFSVPSLSWSHTLLHSVNFTNFPVAKAATGIHACSSSSQSRSCRGGSNRLSLPCLSLFGYFTAVNLISTETWRKHRNVSFSGLLVISQRDKAFSGQGPPSTT